MDQVLAICEVKEKILSALGNADYQDNAKTKKLLEEIIVDLDAFLNLGIDFKHVVEALDDSIFITDNKGVCIYVNPAHQRNTEILPQEVLGRNVRDIVSEGKLFTGGATLDVLKEQKKVFRLSTVNKTNPPSVGYTVGVPLFNEDGSLHQVVVSSRPVLSLQALQEDYGKFLQEANSIGKESIRIISENNYPSKRLAGSSSSLQKIETTIQMAAPTDATILITGESGVGKEVVADEICRLSQRSSKPFIKVNCASIPANLLESELFGYEQGAFSGAVKHGKPGLFEIANGGTILLDEIGEMSLDLQAKLLRAIQNKEIMRVGGTHPINLDLRFLAATNADLKKKVTEGTFRQDLYYRLNVIPIKVPPLRERLDDLEDLIKHFMEYFAAKHHRTFSLTESQLSMMKLYSWPGNIRELENVIEYLTICASGANSVNDEMLQGLLDFSQADETNTFSSGSTLSSSLENYEKHLIESVLRSSGNLRDAGAKLGVNASTISRKIKQYGIKYPGSKDL